MNSQQFLAEPKQEGVNRSYQQDRRNNLKNPLGPNYF